MKTSELNDNSGTAVFDKNTYLCDAAINVENRTNKFIWSEIAQIVHSNKKPQYSLSSILRRTNLFDDVDSDHDFDKERKINENNDSPMNKINIENNTIVNTKKSKGMELLQVTNIIKNVHKEEVKIYLNEIAMLRSQILSMNNLNLDKQMNSPLNTNENSHLLNIKMVELSIENFVPIYIVTPNAVMQEVKLSNVEILPNVFLNEIIENELKEKNDYIINVENLNLKLYKELEIKNNECEDLNRELLKQKELLSKQNNYSNKCQEIIGNLRGKVESMLEESLKKDKYYTNSLKAIQDENNLLKKRVQELDFEKISFTNLMEEIMEVISTYDTDDISKFANNANFLELISNSKNDFLFKNFPKLQNFLIKFVEIINLKIQNLENKKTSHKDNYSQTEIKNKNFIFQNVNNIFIQSICNFYNYNDQEKPIISNYILENSKKEQFNRISNERSMDYISAITNTRLKNEINILKNQLDASKQKFRLKDLENKKLIQEISYLKNKIIRNKSYNSFVNNSNFDLENNECNSKAIKFNKFSKSKNYYSNLDNISNENNWEEIFSVIRQLKNP